MELYWASGSPYAWRVMLGLLFKDLDYTDHLLSFEARDHKQAGFTTLNPRGKVPVLVDGDIVVYESLAILAYLDHSYRRHPLFGSASYDAARIWRKVMEVENYLNSQAQPLVRALYFNRWTERVEDLRAQTSRVLQELDRQEAQAESGSANAVDCLMVPLLKGLERASRKAGASNVGLMPFKLDRWPQLSERLRMVESLDGYARTTPPHWR